jgi:hypothetical protein
VVPFVEMLLDSPRQSLDQFFCISLHEATALFQTLSKKWNQGNPWTSESSPEFDLRKGLGAWKAIGANKSVLSYIAYGVPMRFSSPPPRTSFPSKRDEDPSHSSFIDKEVDFHLKDGLFKVVHPNDAYLVHPVRVVQQGAKLRRIDDMRFANAFQASPMFKMECLEQDTKHVVMEDDILLTRDLSKAYYKIHVEPRSRPFQCFKWNNKLICSLVMLFGWCLAPFFFTKICRPIISFLGALLVRVINFVDDFLFSACCCKP